MTLHVESCIPLHTPGPLPFSRMALRFLQGILPIVSYHAYASKLRRKSNENDRIVAQLSKVLACESGRFKLVPFSKIFTE